MSKKKVKKSMDFPSEDDYHRLKVEATKNRQTMGDFVISMLDFWKENHNS
ncbi:MAG: hypothetical protein ACXADA_24865 [Candidatus Hodarchaeales archaeon]|jgi:hypothetical protein